MAASSLTSLALEARMALELGATLSSWPLLMSAPRGDGHPVLVLPGLSANDASTLVLRRFLRSRGHRVHAWQLGTNGGPTPELMRGLRKRLLDVFQEGEQPVSLVGWSLGGVYARELARRFPDRVRQVITLASPLGGPASKAPPVPCTSIYSTSDAIVDWRSCLLRAAAQHQNVRIESSHFGMGHHPLALYVIANRLAQPADAWRPFEPRGALGVLIRAEAAG
jgi:pimeloyl-ACP methyl ester carboxylesterase